MASVTLAPGASPWLWVLRAHSFPLPFPTLINSLNEHLLSTNYEPDTVLGAGETGAQTTHEQLNGLYMIGSRLMEEMKKMTRARGVKERRDIHNLFTLLASAFINLRTYTILIFEIIISAML